MFIAGQAELAHGCLMALRRSERIQPFSLHGVGGHALTDVVQDTKVVQSVGVSLLRRKSEQAQCLAHVPRETTATVYGLDGEIALGLGVTLLGSGPEQPQRLRNVPGCPPALLAHARQIELGGGVTRLGSHAVPAHCLMVVLLDTLALTVGVAEAPLGPGMPTLGRTAIPPERRRDGPAVVIQHRETILGLYVAGLRGDPQCFGQSRNIFHVITTPAARSGPEGTR